MTVDIRRLELEEAINITHFLSSYAFTPTPPLPEFEKYAEKVRSREGANYYAVFVDNEPLASSCETTPFAQNLRGDQFKMAGVAGVASHPAARRSGYVRELLHFMYQEFKKKGYAVSCLYPFKESFYQKLGYVTLPQTKKMSFNASNLQPVLHMNIKGSYDLLTYEEGYDAYRTYCEKHQLQVHGMAVFTIPQKKAAKFHQSWLVFAKQQNEIIGVMKYTLEEKIFNQAMIASEFLFSNAQGKFLLLNWIARHIDQVDKVVLSIRPDQFGENFFTDIRPEYEVVIRAPMARVIDISALDGVSVGEGNVTVRVSDPDCEWNNGVWTFDSKAGHLKLIKSAHPDCELTIHGVTALVYGVYDPEEFELRGWGNPDLQQQAVLRMMFPPAIPYVHAIF